VRYTRKSPAGARFTSEVEGPLASGLVEIIFFPNDREVLELFHTDYRPTAVIRPYMGEMVRRRANLDA
jgi:hypothetical protein